MVSYSYVPRNASPCLDLPHWVGLAILLGGGLGGSLVSLAPAQAQSTVQPTPSLTFGQPLPVANSGPVFVPVLPPGSEALSVQIPPAPSVSPSLTATTRLSPFTSAAPSAPILSNQPRYVVYVRGGSNLLLEQVRRLEPGAFRRDLEGQPVIQAGLFTSEINAESLMDQLSVQGILAEVDELDSTIANVGGIGSLDTVGFGGNGANPGAASSFVSPFSPGPSAPFPSSPSLASTLPSPIPQAPIGPASSFNPNGLAALPSSTSAPYSGGLSSPGFGAPNGFNPGNVGSELSFTGSNAPNFAPSSFYTTDIPTVPFTGSPLPTGTLVTSERVKSYYIAIPISAASLNETYELLAEANGGTLPAVEQRSSRRGPYLALGPFSDRTIANSVEAQLLEAGLRNARVYYGY